MDVVVNVLHVVTAVFIVGPMAILPMTAMRAVRAGNGRQVAVLASSTRLLSWLSLIVFVLGFGAMGLAPDRYGLSFGTPWILWSIILYLVAFLASLLVVVPAMRRAAAELGASSTALDRSGAPALAGVPGAGSGPGSPAIMAGSGVVSLLLLAVVVLMVWKP